MIAAAQQIAYDPARDKILRFGPVVGDPKALAEFPFDIVPSTAEKHPYNAVIAVHPPSYPGVVKNHYFLARLDPVTAFANYYPHQEHGWFGPADGSGAAAAADQSAKTPGTAHTALPDSEPVTIGRYASQDNTRAFLEQGLRESGIPMDTLTAADPSISDYIKQGSLDVFMWPVPQGESTSSADIEDGLHQVMDAKVSVMTDPKLSMMKVGEIIGAWNLDPASAKGLQIQAAAARMFHVDDPHFEEQLKASEGTNAPEVYDSYVRAQYQRTQDWYREQGISTVDLCRGIGFTADKLPPELQGMKVLDQRDVTLSQNPLSSWTTSDQTAELFARIAVTPHEIGYQENPPEIAGSQKFVVTARLPVSRIFSNGVVGAGVAHEGEHIVIDSGLRVRIRRVR